MLGRKPHGKKNTFVYNRGAIKTYMKKYWKVKKHKGFISYFDYFSGYNKRFPYFENDCTNYVSQCIWYGALE